MNSRAHMFRAAARAACALVVLTAAVGCAETRFVSSTVKRIGGPSPQASPGLNGRYKIGSPYQIRGAWYYPAVDYQYDETGIASWYGPNFHGKQTANGEVFNQNGLTAAHRTLPMPSRVRVTNLENGRSLVMTVNDRGPFSKGRIIDLSRRSAQLLGVIRKGTAKVRVTIIPDESRALAARYQSADAMSAGRSPITVDKMPKPGVSAADLPPPPGGDAAPARPEPEPLLQVRAPARAEPAQTAAAEPANEGAVEIVPVKASNIYVQAAAFSVFENANIARARLASLGPIAVSRALVNGVDYYRVRLGPFTDVETADRLLESAAASGFPDARIIVD
ncbi:MAG: septal ring lytic transglycosylase RlpA family protein [Rhodospirillales bacterium]